MKNDKIVQKKRVTLIGKDDFTKQDVNTALTSVQTYCDELVRNINELKNGEENAPERTIITKGPQENLAVNIDGNAKTADHAKEADLAKKAEDSEKLGGIEADEYLTKDDLDDITNTTVENSRRLGGIKADQYLLRPDAEKIYASKEELTRPLSEDPKNQPLVVTKATNADILGGKPADAYTTDEELKTKLIDYATREELTREENPTQVAKAKYADEAGNAINLGGRPASDYLTNVDIDLTPYTTREELTREVDPTVVSKAKVADLANDIADNISTSNFNVTGTLNSTGNTNLKGTSIVGDLSVTGNITQSGESYITHAEDFYTKKDIIHTRENAKDPLKEGEITGIIADSYDAQKNYGALGFDRDGVARVGDVTITKDENGKITNIDTSKTQAIATRENIPKENGIARWNKDDLKFDTVLEKDMTVGNATTANGLNDGAEIGTLGTTENAVVNKAWVKEQISTAFVYKGDKTNFADLPTVGNEVGDVYYVTSEKALYVWNGTSWDELNLNIDVSDFIKKADEGTLNVNSARSTRAAWYGDTANIDDWYGQNYWGKEFTCAAKIPKGTWPTNIHSSSACNITIKSANSNNSADNKATIMTLYAYDNFSKPATWQRRYANSDNKWLDWQEIATDKSIEENNNIYNWHLNDVVEYNQWVKITINSSDAWMLQATLDIYEGYNQYKVMFSGYNYIGGTGHKWHAPSAYMISNEKGNVFALPFMFGYDIDPTWPTNRKWIAFKAYNYPNVKISNIVDGFHSFDLKKDAFKFELVSEATLRDTTKNTIQKEYKNLTTLADDIKLGGASAKYAKYIKYTDVKDISIDNITDEGHYRCVYPDSGTLADLPVFLQNSGYYTIDVIKYKDNSDRQQIVTSWEGVIGIRTLNNGNKWSPWQQIATTDWKPVNLGAGANIEGKAVVTTDKIFENTSTISTGSLNDFKKPGMYRLAWQNTITDTPSWATSGYAHGLMVQKYDDYITQLFFNNMNDIPSSGYSYRICNNNGTWGDWKKFATTDNVIEKSDMYAHTGCTEGWYRVLDLYVDNHSTTGILSLGHSYWAWPDQGATFSISVPYLMNDEVWNAINIVQLSSTLSLPFDKLRVAKYKKTVEGKTKYHFYLEMHYWTKSNSTMKASWVGNTSNKIIMMKAVPADETPIKTKEIHIVNGGLGYNGKKIATQEYTNTTAREIVAESNSVTSQRDFTYGTLIKTSINYNVDNGAPFYLTIKGNSYGRLYGIHTIVQGYIYSGTIINYGVEHLGMEISGLTAENVDGVLCFWFPRQSYWEGYSVYCSDAWNYNLNKVTAIINTTDPKDTIDSATGKPKGTKVVELWKKVHQTVMYGNVYPLNDKGTKPLPESYKDLNDLVSIGVWDVNNKVEYLHTPPLFYKKGHITITVSYPCKGWSRFIKQEAENIYGDKAWRVKDTSNGSWTTWETYAAIEKTIPLSGSNINDKLEKDGIDLNKFWEGGRYIGDIWNKLSNAPSEIKSAFVLDIIPSWNNHCIQMIRMYSSDDIYYRIGASVWSDAPTITSWKRFATSTDISNCVKWDNVNDLIVGKAKNLEPFVWDNKTTDLSWATGPVWDNTITNFKPTVFSNGPKDGETAIQDIQTFVNIPHHDGDKKNGQFIHTSSNRLFFRNVEATKKADWQEVATKSWTEGKEYATKPSIRKQWSTGLQDSASGWMKISINSTTFWMLAFDINVYQGYAQYTANVSGYNYQAQDAWYSPAASLASSTESSMRIKFGHEKDNSSKKWIAFPLTSYYGISITNVVNGYKQIPFTDDLFTFTRVAKEADLGVTDSDQVLNGFATKDYVTTRGYQTETQVQTKIDAKFNLSGTTLYIY